MMDKINDNMNANGQQKLSMEDLENVNGGVDGLYATDGTYHSKADILNLGHTLAQNFGYDIAGGVICEMFGVSPSEAKRINKDGVSNDTDKMDWLIHQMFLIYDRIEDSGHSY